MSFMLLKAFFYLHPEHSGNTKETYGFKSRTSPPNIPELANFERSIQELIRNIKFRNTNNEFQKKLAHDISTNIKSSQHLLISADRTTNFYNMDVKLYKELLHNNVTKDYRKADSNLIPSINKEAKAITSRLDIEDRVYKIAEREAFITIKDHKANFPNSIPCRLINPSKSEIGYISKQITDKINCAIRNNIRVNQWTNTASAIEWFKNITDKHSHSFIIFDIVEFYPSITANLLDEALNFAAQYIKITDEERNILHHTKKSVLINNGQPWKKTSSEQFDITMGSFDGAETCELVGLFILNTISNKLPGSFGLYRDDGLAAIKGTSRTIENIKKDLCKIFQNYNLKITVECNKKTVNFLDVTLDLTSGDYYPYSKPNNSILYIHKQSNHPPQICKNLPTAINKRLTNISSNANEFNKAAPPYQSALKESGYQHKLTYQPSATKAKKKRQRNIIWYNPPYSSNVSTNIGHRFIKLVKEHFPKHHVLNKIFNKNTIKVSYSCMNNIKNIIDNHNKSLLRKAEERDNSNSTKKCNCRTKNSCPLNGECQTKNVVYQATVTSGQDEHKETYIGITETSFKTRYNNHRTSFKYDNKRSATELSNYIWDLKSRNVNFNITWKIIARAPPYNISKRKCGLCTAEKYFIIFQPHLATLNERRELITTCRHSRKFTLSNC